MSMRYKGGVISATSPTTSTSSASGSWTLQQQMQATAAGNWPTNAPFYIEEVFSTWLYTGNGSTQTITNGIDLAGKGGLTWIKRRSGAEDHFLADTARGANYLSTNTTSAQGSQSVFSFSASGFNLLLDNSLVNASGSTYASWTFREQPKFFDVVTYTGNGVDGRTVAHNLGAVPGCIIVKCLNDNTDWPVYHRSLNNGVNPNQYRLRLNTTAAQSGPGTEWSAGVPTDTTFTLTNAGDTNASGRPYVAYLFAHNAGGFGLSGTDNVISCGGYTGSGVTGLNVTLGYEPQWLMIKRAIGGAGNWQIIDNMRGMPVGSNDATLQANLSAAETLADGVSPTATGFLVTSVGSEFNTNGDSYIYIAIRRGPMKVPTTGTSVLGLNARTGTDTNATVTGGAGVTDLAIIKARNNGTNWVWVPRLAGKGYLSSNGTTAETDAGTTILQTNPWDVMDGVKVGTTSTLTNASANTYINYLIDRAPGFMDVVCYTGTGVARTVAHNLTVAPELMIIKRRDGTSTWPVWSKPVFDLSSSGRLLLNETTERQNSSALFNSTAPTNTVFTLGDSVDANASGATYINYLFASCPGVSRVGSFTQVLNVNTVVNCGFTGGARFVMIKLISGTSNWFVWDTARGIVSGNEPYSSFNLPNVEVTASDGLIPNSSGFEVNGSWATPGTYIFLAIA
jgi:hypothetical protein